MINMVTKRIISMLFIFLAMVNLSLNINTNESSLPAIYIFGDSLFDVGTNSFLPNCTSRADMQFYGIDSPSSKPIGRFSNGYNTADRIVNLLGYSESPPPFLYLVQNYSENFKSENFKGVNFASGGSGLLQDTGKRFNRVIPLGEQIQQFETVHNNISEALNDTSKYRIHQSIFLISVGSNDILEFFDNLSKSNSHPSNFMQVMRQFMKILMKHYQTHLQNLLNLGARKFGILSVPSVGCVPILRANTSDGQCVTQINVFAEFFHVELNLVLQNLNLVFPDMKYSLGNTYDITLHMSQNPPIPIKDVKSACCGNQTLMNGGVPCSPDAEVCENRSQFLFWDQYHPSEFACTLAAITLYSGQSPYVAPTNFSLLLQPS